MLARDEGVEVEVGVGGDAQSRAGLAEFPCATKVAGTESAIVVNEVVCVGGWETRVSGMTSISNQYIYRKDKINFLFWHVHTVSTTGPRLIVSWV